MNNKKYLNIIDARPQEAEETLPQPFSQEDLKFLRKKRGYVEEPNLTHSYLKDGIAIKGLDIGCNDNLIFVQNLLKKCFKTINTVEDEHLKDLGILAAGFLRFLELGFLPKTCKREGLTCQSDCQTRNNIELNLYFRFTTDQCPAGLRMMLKAKKLLLEQLTQELHANTENISINCIHGGSPWGIEDVYDLGQKEVLKTLIEINTKYNLENPGHFLSF